MLSRVPATVKTADVPCHESLPSSLQPSPMSKTRLLVLTQHIAFLIPKRYIAVHLSWDDGDCGNFSNLDWSPIAVPDIGTVEMLIRYSALAICITHANDLQKWSYNCRKMQNLLVLQMVLQTALQQPQSSCVDGIIQCMLGQIRIFE